MKLHASNGKMYDIPYIPQVGDYEYAINLDCSCNFMCKGGWAEKLNAWHCDGFYDSQNGLMICFTCNVCGDRIYYHLGGCFDDYAEMGMFDEYLCNE